MSKYIDAEWLKELYKPYENFEGKMYSVPVGAILANIDDAPSLDICFCKDCEFENTRKCPPHRMGLIHDASDYCSYGIRKTDGADKHDEAVEALGHLIKHMKGADRKTENSSEKPNNCEDEPQTCSVNGRPYSECADCEHFKCMADEPQTERSE